MTFESKILNYNFQYISIESFIIKHKKSNSESDVEQLRKDLMHFQQLKTQGVKCNCANELWVIGSAISGKGCFTCITGETDCSDDYEIE